MDPKKCPNCDDEIKNHKDALFSLIAHEIKTPLAGVKWALKTILSGDTGTINTEQRDLILKSYESNEQALSLIEELLSAERAGSDDFNYKIEKEDINKVLRQAIAEVRADSERSDVKIIIDIPEAEVLVNIDTEKMQLALQNIIENAMNYSKKDGIVLVTSKKVSHVVLLSVKDDGIGIPELEKDHIFKRFYRAENAKKFIKKGFGLGLFIVKNIVENHKGRIWFESKPDNGTKFVIELPL